ncbi:MAG: hypothetical protein Q7T04_08120, partial [Dehalococcoidia bacterium]|nr:hypothetical protein [Dehalococcoidia bacterium]
MTGNDDLDRYRIFLKQQEYQDKLFWSRVQTLYLVQAAVLGSSFAIRDRWFGWAILGIGAVISTLVALLCCYDWQDSQANKTSM